MVGGISTWKDACPTGYQIELVETFLPGTIGRVPSFTTITYIHTGFSKNEGSMMVSALALQRLLYVSILDNRL